MAEKEFVEKEFDLGLDMEGVKPRAEVVGNEPSAATRRARKKLERERKDEKRPVLRTVMDFLLVIGAGIVIAYLLCTYVIISAEVPTGSMIPTINRGDKLIGLRLSYVFSDPKRGESAIFKCPEPGANYDGLFVKRVIGLPGETVTIDKGEVWITTVEGEKFKLDEDYLRETPYPDRSENNAVYVLGDNEYFVMGDNRNGSHDSRFFGAVTRDRMVAKVLFKYYKGFEVIE